MDRELARKRPAIVTSATATRPATEVARLGRDQMVVRAETKGALAAEVTRLYQAGRIERAYTSGRRGDIWLARVTIKRGPRKALRASLWAAGVLGVLGAVVVLLRLLVEALVPLLPYILGFFGLVILAGAVLALAGGGDTKTINIKM